MAKKEGKQKPRDEIEKNKEGEGETGGEGSIGGAAGEVQFRYRDAYSLGPRDDQLPAAEVKRLLVVHNESHKAWVVKQKQTRAERKAFKEGKKNHQAGLGLGGGSGAASPYKKHPISDKAQFSGRDRQVISLPTEYVAETNPEFVDRLENRLENRYQLQNAPKFNPKPRPL